jgi:hypothetical protein
VNPVEPVERTSVFSSRQWLFVLARVYLGVSFFFSDHGNAQPNELTGFLKIRGEEWLFLVSTLS